MKHSNSSLSRRRFLQSTGALAAAALPAWYLEQCAAMSPQTSTASSAPSEQVRLALIGCGGQGRGDARNAKRFGKIVAICDVDANHLDAAKKDFPDADGYADFRKLLERKDIDAVICGTVDHWHTLVSIGAMKAGKDVYCEKPLTLTIDEGKRLVQVQRETGQVLQTGTQQRSGREFRLACDLVRNGRIGKIEKAEVWLPAGLRQGPFNTAAVPTGFDYDFWQGQTPAVPYVKERTHFSFRYWWEYSGGTMTDWGAHHNDIVLWALDMDRSGPVEYRREAVGRDDPGRLYGCQRVRRDLHLCQRCRAHVQEHDCQRMVGRRQGSQRPAAWHQVPSAPTAGSGSLAVRSKPAIRRCCRKNCPRAAAACT